MIFNNVDIFEKWLKDNLKPEYAKYVDWYLKEWLDDVDTDYGNTAMPIFELSRLYTKSGYCEDISYVVETTETEDGCFEHTYIF